MITIVEAAKVFLWQGSRVVSSCSELRIPVAKVISAPKTLQAGGENTASRSRGLAGGREINEAHAQGSLFEVEAEKFKAQLLKVIVICRDREPL